VKNETLKERFERRAKRSKRQAARLRIVQTVNAFKRGYKRPVGAYLYAPRLFDVRNINEAVRIARHHSLVKPELLEEAGFNVTARK
jgi:hypothetical protein